MFTFFAEKPTDRYSKADSSLIVLTLLMWGLGIVALWVCSAGFGERAFGDPMYFVYRQLISSLVGFVAFVFFAVVKIDFIKKLLPAMVIVSVILCLLVFVPGVGVERNGARRWIRIPFMATFQPSEAIKLVMVFYLANQFEKLAETVVVEEKTVFPAFVGLVLFSGINLLQHDFSTAVFTFAVGLVLFIVSGEKMSWLAPFSLIVIPLLFLMIFLEPYRMNRLIGFLSQESYQQTYNYQLMAARRAISSGGFWGQGIGSGLTYIDSIPEIQSDYIFAGWTEAMGLLGVTLYFVILGFFGWRCFVCAMRCGNRFAAFATFGFGTSIVAQSLVNLAVVSGVVPTTGIPLPFFSSGGSSIIFTLAMCGFMVNASRIEMNEIEKVSAVDADY